jgi:pyridoxal phosphate enzyme (YggS family)
MIGANESRIPEWLGYVKQDIETVCRSCDRDPVEVLLVAVSKFRPVSAIETAIQAGQLHFGENRMQDLKTKMDEIPNPNVVWHLIGNVQTNKLRQVCHRVNWIHSVDKLKYLEEIEKRAGAADHQVNVLLQVNISSEPQKGGIAPDELASFLGEASETNWQHLRIRGLMGMAEPTPDQDVIRSQFRLLRELRDQFQKPFRTKTNGQVDLVELSMGMSSDMNIAIEEGATMVRVGTAIFG